MKDKEAKRCKRCNVDFHSVKRRKHHCRMCGFVVCDKCSRNRVQLKANGKKSRVCSECFNQIAPRHMRSVSSRGSMTPTPTQSFKNNLLPITDENNEDKQQQQPLTDNEMDDDDDEPMIIHEAVTTDEVDDIIDKLAKSMRAQTSKIPNIKPQSPEKNTSFIRTSSLPERSNTEGTMVEYDTKRQSTPIIDPYRNQKNDGYPFESPQQPLLSNDANRCCKCIVL